MRRAFPPLFLGIDVGTRSTKALLVDVEARTILARAQREYGLIEGLEPGVAEQDPDTWMEALRDVVREVIARADVSADRIVAIGVAGQQHGLVTLDAEGCVLRPAKLWCDVSTADEARELEAQFSRPLPVGYTASKLLWLKRHEIHRFGKIAHVLLPHDYVNFRLTGRATMEAGDASGTGLFDPQARAFDPAALRAIDSRLASWLPPLIGPLDLAGTLTDDAAEWLGLAPGTRVSAGSGDNMASAIGAGATREGIVVASLGTSGTVFSSSPRPIHDPLGLIAPFCDATGAYLPLLCVMNCAAVLEEVRTGFSTVDDLTHDTLTAAARHVPIGSHGVTFVPYLSGERSPALPNATGTLLGLRPNLLRASIVYRAALEGIAINLAAGVDRMRALGLTVQSARLVGGAAQNPLLQEILAATFEAPVVALAEPESAALGAALQACAAHRHAEGASITIDDISQDFVRPATPSFEPQAEQVREYRKVAERFHAAVRKLHRLPARSKAEQEQASSSRRQGLLFDA